MDYLYVVPDNRRIVSAESYMVRPLFPPSSCWVLYTLYMVLVVVEQSVQCYRDVSCHVSHIHCVQCTHQHICAIWTASNPMPAFLVENFSSTDGQIWCAGSEQGTKIRHPDVVEHRHYMHYNRSTSASFSSVGSRR